jgi:hypothetical protein
MEPTTRTGPDRRRLADSLLAALVPGSASGADGLEHAIQVELLVTALEDATRPRTLSDLLSVLERIAVGDVARALVAVVRKRAATDPHLVLTDLAERTA